MILKVFSSYSQKDFPLRNALELAIRNDEDQKEEKDEKAEPDEIRFAVDNFSALPGDQLEEWIDTEIISCDVLFTIITPNSLSSWWVGFELMLARRYNLRIVALVDNACDRNDSRLPPWLGSALTIPVDSRALADFNRLSDLATSVKEKLKTVMRSIAPRQGIRDALRSAHLQTRQLRTMIFEPNAFRHAFRAEQATLVLEAAVNEIGKLRGNDYEQNLSLSQAFVIRAKPIFSAAKATYATSVDFVSTFWEKEADGLAADYLKSQRGKVKRLFVFSTPRQATRHLDILAAHYRQYGEVDGGGVLVMALDRYGDFIRDHVETKKLQTSPLLDGDFAILQYDDKKPIYYEARLTKDALTCTQLHPGLSPSQTRFVEQLERVFRETPAGSFDPANTGILRWSPRLAETTATETDAWKACLTQLFHRSGGGEEAVRDRDIFHLVFFSRDAASMGSRDDGNAARRLREVVSDSVDELTKLRNRHDPSKPLVKELWFGDFNKGLKQINVSDGQFGGPIRTGGMFVDNFPYCLMMRFENKEDLESYYRDRSHSKAREKIFSACDPQIANLYAFAHSMKDTGPRSEVYRAIEAAASTFVVRADYVEHEDLDWIVKKESRIPFRV